MVTWLGEVQFPALFVAEPSGTITPPALPTPPMPWVQPDFASAEDVELGGPRPPVVIVTWPAEEALQSAGSYDFFEDFHVIPRAISLGNLLSDTSVPIEVFSAFRHEVHPWSSFVNGAGAGVELGGEPSLPELVEPLTGYQMTVDVSASGPPFVDDLLDFVFDIGTISVPIMIQRIVLWGAEPELPYAEILGFLTDVLGPRSGKEQRFALRENPRQFFQYEYLIDEGEAWQLLENQLFDFQRRAFGVPVWRDDSYLTVAATAGASSITVDGTAFRDYRVGGLAVILTSQTVFDVVVIQSIGAMSLTFDSTLINSYPVDTPVYPMLACNLSQVVDGERYPMNLVRLRIEWEVQDNEANIADVSAFASYGGKVLIDRDNVVRSSTSREVFGQELVIVDNLTGVPLVDSPWDRHKRGHALVLRAAGRQAVWELRQLAYALRGRWASFYAVRHREDLLPVAQLNAASNLMDVANYGYAQFVRHRQPKNAIRVTFNNGDPALVREVIDSESVDASTDRLTLDMNWPDTVPVAEIERVEYVEKVRLDDDDVRIEYADGGHRAYLVSTVKAVFD